MYKDVSEFIKSLYPGKKSISLHEPRFIGNEKKYLDECIDSTFVSSVGKYVNLFEEKIKNYTGAKYAIATSNGTSALHSALLISGVKSGDLVITQPLSFIATSNAISYVGASPLYIDVDKKTLSLSDEKLSNFFKKETSIKNGKCYHKKSKKKISACVPMHTFGHPARIDCIAELCKKYKVALVEDAAESIGSTYKNKQTGTFGFTGVYSFNGNKIITCGGGGIILTDNDKAGKLAKHLTTQAKVPHRWNFEHDAVGYNYRMPNINAALACAQFENLEKFLNNKRNLANTYKDFFDEQGISFFVEPDNCKSNYWLNCIFLKNRKERDAFLKFTNDNDVMTRPAWTLSNKLPMYKKCIAGNLENAEWVSDRLVNIPSSVTI